MIRSDNGTEYIDKKFVGFLSDHGILHQTSCLDTSPQNGVVEDELSHFRSGSIIDVYHECSTFPMEEWGSDDLMTSTFLTNRMPSRILDMKYPSELLLGENKFVVPPKVFGCTCFVRDHRPSMTKLDPRAIKCIFIDYPAGQQGYKCWSTSEVAHICKNMTPFIVKKQIWVLYLKGLTSHWILLVKRGRVQVAAVQETTSLLGWSNNLNNLWLLGLYHLFYQNCHMLEVGQSQMKSTIFVCTHGDHG
jgi:hypothetical protein